MSSARRSGGNYDAKEKENEFLNKGDNGKLPSAIPLSRLTHVPFHPLEFLNHIEVRHGLFFLH